MLAAQPQPLHRVVSPLICAASCHSEGTASSLGAEEAAWAPRVGTRENGKTATCRSCFPSLSHPIPAAGLRQHPGACCGADEEGSFTAARERQHEPPVQAGTTSPPVIKQQCFRLEVLAL